MSAPAPQAQLEEPGAKLEEPGALLEVDHVTVSFDGFKALNNLSFSMEAGSVHVLIGPNGAGKSTLLDTIIGRVRPTEGRIIFKGEDISALPEFRIVQRGICRKFQTPGVLDELTVEANILVAATKDRRSWRSLTNVRTASERERVEDVLNMIGLVAKRKLPAAQLAHGERQWLEIGMVVASDADLLLLDEPAAGMTHSEAGATAALIRQLAGRHALIVIDHDMDFVEQIAAPVSVLHMGSMLAQGTVEEMRRHPQVAAVYLGRPPTGTDAHDGTVPHDGTVSHDGTDARDVTDPHDDSEPPEGNDPKESADARA